MRCPKVLISVNADTNTITCHAIELWVHSVKVVREDGTAVTCLETRFIEEDQTITFILAETLTGGTTASIHLSFSGLLNDALRGFYRSEYVHEGTKRIMAASQFQACDARRAFVCWDEPAIKAKFEISMTTPAHLTAVSNMHVLSTFGNLVTMEWWTGLWLNEGFAHFMEYDAVDHIFPEWKMWENFVQEVTLDSAFREDALLRYTGASVIRMLCEYLGKDVFYRGIQLYLKKFIYSNAVTVDLWHALEEASSLPLSDMMNSWTKQTGFPVVTLRRTADGFQLAQTRFFSDASVVDADDSRWDLPLTGLVDRGHGPELKRLGIWSAKDRPHRNAACEIHAPQTVVSKIPTDSPWVKLNCLQQGFFIDNYDADGWYQLQHPCKVDLVLSDVDRMCLLDNAFVLTRAGKLDVASALNFSRAFANDPSYLIWKSLSTHLTFYGQLIRKDAAASSKLQAYVRQFYAVPLARLGWFTQDSDEESTAFFRSEVIRMLGTAKDSGVHSSHALPSSNLGRLFRSASRVTSDLRAVIFRVAATHLQEAAYEQLRALHESSNSPEVKNDCLGGLGAIQSKWKDTLEWALSGKVRP
ncbi:hypothetical protein DYB32_006734 [Aphanomyces invadans]|uniref:Aminopeptidase n=1 Tax=Aphanomyces invadans TaxID=157072 RepID=A0A3R6VUI3_9STRA|nr:hypothetical protein DYB32_006734 [Aphanomyces invadans]